MSDLLRNKLQIQFHQYYPEDQKKDTQKWFPTYSHDKGRTWQRQNKMGNLCKDMWTKTGLASKNNTLILNTVPGV